MQSGSIMQAIRAAFVVSVHRVSIRANSGSAYSKKQFAKEVEAEIDLPSALDAGDFVKGRLLDLTTSQRHVLSRMKEGSLYI
jgi:hypothetical protein